MPSMPPPPMPRSRTGARPPTLSQRLYEHARVSGTESVYNRSRERGDLMVVYLDLKPARCFYIPRDNEQELEVILKDRENIDTLFVDLANLSLRAVGATVAATVSASATVAEETESHLDRMIKQEMELWERQQALKEGWIRFVVGCTPEERIQLREEINQKNAESNARAESYKEQVREIYNLQEETIQMIDAMEMEGHTDQIIHAREKISECHRKRLELEAKVEKERHYVLMLKDKDDYIYNMRMMRS